MAKEKKVLKKKISKKQVAPRKKEKVVLPVKTKGEETENEGKVSDLEDTGVDSYLFRAGSSRGEGRGSRRRGGD